MNNQNCIVCKNVAQVNDQFMNGECTNNINCPVCGYFIREETRPEGRHALNGAGREEHTLYPIKGGRAGRRNVKSGKTLPG